MDGERSGTLERMAIDHYRISLVVDMHHRIDVGCVGEDVIGRLGTNKMTRLGVGRSDGQKATDDCCHQAKAAKHIVGKDGHSLVSLWTNEKRLESVCDACKGWSVEGAEVLVEIFVMSHNGNHRSVVGGELERWEKHLPVILLAQFCEPVTHSAVG